MPEVYPGQSDIVAGKLREEEALQEADRELLKATSDPLKRSEILRRIAGREGSLATRRRFLATLTGADEKDVLGAPSRIRFADTDKAFITQAAEGAGMTFSQFVRQAAIKAATKYLEGGEKSK